MRWNLIFHCKTEISTQPHFLITCIFIKNQVIYYEKIPELVDSCTVAVGGARRQILVHLGDGYHVYCSSQLLPVEIFS